MKYLLDECVNSSNDFHGGKKFIRTVDILGMGAKDPEILQYIKGKKLVPVTYDKGLVIQCISQGNTVIFHRPHIGKSYLIKIKEIPKIDPVTYYLSKNETIVIP